MNDAELAKCYRGKTKKLIGELTIRKSRGLFINLIVCKQKKSEDSNVIVKYKNSLFENRSKLIPSSHIGSQVMFS